MKGYMLFVLAVVLRPTKAWAPPDNHKYELFDVEGPPTRHDVPDDVIIRLPSHSVVRYQKPPGFKKSAKILFWSTMYGSMDKWSWWFTADKMRDTCPQLQCEFLTDKSRLNESDALLFMDFKPDLDPKDPDFIGRFPSYRFPHQRWVFFTPEAPYMPHRNHSALNGLFNWTMTYRLDSDVVAHYGKIMLNTLPSIEEKRASWSRNYAENKTRFAAWFVSHCTTSGRRELYVQELQKYAEIDVYGQCGNYTCEKFQKSCYERLSKEYKFYLSFENSISKDYVTEKFFEALASDVIPVVFGGADYSKFAPLGSYINALDFESPRALAEYLHSLDQNDDEYNQFFDWKRGYMTPTVKTCQLWACDLCLKVLDPKMPTKVYDDMEEWWNGRTNARPWALKEDEEPKLTK